MLDFFSVITHDIFVSIIKKENTGITHEFERNDKNIGTQKIARITHEFERNDHLDGPIFTKIFERILNFL